VILSLAQLATHRGVAKNIALDPTPNKEKKEQMDNDTRGTCLFACSLFVHVHLLLLSPLLLSVCSCTPLFHCLTNDKGLVLGLTRIALIGSLDVFLEHRDENEELTLQLQIYRFWLAGVVED